MGRFLEYYTRGVVALCVTMVLWTLCHVLYMNPVLFGMIGGAIGSFIIITALLGWFIKDVMKL